MYWEESDDDADYINVPEDVVDLLFNIQCKGLPIDHGKLLSDSICQQLPWVADESQAAIHQIHVAESSHGWQRPDDKDDILLPSRRTRLVLRMPSQRLSDCQNLVGQTLDVGGHSLQVGEYKIRPLSKLTTIFSRYVDTDEGEQDNEFIDRMLALLSERNIRVKKMMSGLIVMHSSNDDEIVTRKLMVSGLSIDDSLDLQQKGIGNKMLMGIGIFLPHKGIDSVKSS